MIGGVKNKFDFQNCKEYNLGLWQCPTFLFVVMGIVNMCAMIGIYIVVNKYDSPELVVASVSGISILIFIVGASVINGVEKIATLNNAKSEFISIASHQLKAPLSGMRWSTDILLSGKTGKLEARQEEYLKDIQENTSRMIRLVNDLLDVTRIDSGKMNMKKQEVDLNEIVEGVISELGSFALANNVELKFSPLENICKIYTDPIRIKMVVQNFIDNSIKYAGRKKGLVEISLEDKNGSVYFSVKDYGLGIPDSEKKHIFDKFFRGGGIVRTQTIGTGLGLYIARAAIESSGGKIGFNSKEGEGSTFWFSFPGCIKQPLKNITAVPE
ncbi:MAG: HAMP domain-containing sensor histidine kinase, partial [Minisyncoccia bacterium]